MILREKSIANIISSTDSIIGSTRKIDDFINSFRHPRSPVHGPSVKVYISSDIERREAQTETIHVPQGVKVKVIRKRTIQHNVHILQNATSGIDLGVDVLNLLQTSIHSEFTRTYGHDFLQSETFVNEIELNGDNSTQYEITWRDVWRHGSVEYEIQGVTSLLPFELQERTELEVKSV